MINLFSKMSKSYSAHVSHPICIFPYSGLESDIFNYKALGLLLVLLNNGIKVVVNYGCSS